MKSINIIVALEILPEIPEGAFKHAAISSCGSGGFKVMTICLQLRPIWKQRRVLSRDSFQTKNASSPAEKFPQAGTAQEGSASSQNVTFNLSYNV